MANISDIIKGRADRDQARTEQLRADRENLSHMRDSALEDITTKPDRYLFHHQGPGYHHPGLGHRPGGHELSVS